MTSIEEATIRFAADIKETEVYQEYRQQLDAIKKEAALYEKVNELRLKNFKLQSSEQCDGLLEQMERLEEEYADIMDDPLVGDFLRAELAFCRLMQDINKYITLELEFG